MCNRGKVTLWYSPRFKQNSIMIWNHFDLIFFVDRKKIPVPLLQSLARNWEARRGKMDNLIIEVEDTFVLQGSKTILRKFKCIKSMKKPLCEYLDANFRIKTFFHRLLPIQRNLERWRERYQCQPPLIKMRTRNAT